MDKLDELYKEYGKAVIQFKIWENTVNKLEQAIQIEMQKQDSKKEKMENK